MTFFLKLCNLQPIQEDIMFQLDAQLAADSRLIASLASSDWLLMNDSRFVWLAQVPRFAGARLLVDLPKGCVTRSELSPIWWSRFFDLYLIQIKSTSRKLVMWYLNYTFTTSLDLPMMRCGLNRSGGKRRPSLIGRLNIAIVWLCFGRTFSTSLPGTLYFLF